MIEAGLLDAAFRLSVLAAALGAAACVVVAARRRSSSRGSASGVTAELTWSLVPPALLAALLMLLGSV